jgi:hypothetical protein
MTPALVDRSFEDYIAWRFPVAIHGMISFVIFYRTDVGIILESTISYCLCPLLPTLFPPRRFLRLSKRPPSRPVFPLLVAHCRLLHPSDLPLSICCRPCPACCLHFRMPASIIVRSRPRLPSEAPFCPYQFLSAVPRWTKFPASRPSSTSTACL